MSRGKQFRTVKTPKVWRNKFDLSHEKRLTADMFMLTPVLCDDCVPGDKWRMGNEIIVRMNPLVAPIMHEINIFVHYYFVPYRLLWDDWEKFITGGQDGKFTADVPKWSTGDRTESSLWDYCGFNVNVAGKNILTNPVVFPRRAYNKIWNEYYRDPNIMDEIDLDWVNAQTKDLHVRCWEKDYFTSMLPWQQRGVAPALPISGITSAVFQIGTSGGHVSSISYYPTVQPWNNDEGFTENSKAVMDKNTVDLSEASTFDVSDLRLAFQVQRFLERNARAGARYTEFLKSHFPAYPRDDRLQRAEYIGGTKTPIIVSEVLQTSQSADTPQGNMAGHGISADRTYVDTYNVQEHGLIMGIMSIMPRSMYSQGIDRVWLKESRYDYYFPEFANLSEQAVYSEELFNYTPAPIDKVIGYQGRFDEYRFKRNTIHGKFLTDFEYWHMGRKFSNAPTLNADLVRPNADERLALKRVLAAQSEPMFLITFGNKLHVTRPMPYIAEPGLIDHN